MAKKKQSKKHRFKYVEPSTAAGIELSAGRDMGISRPTASTKTGRLASSGTAVGSRDFSYVAGDVRRIFVLAVGLVLLEVVLWYLLSHTGLGPAVYNSFSV